MKWKGLDWLREAGILLLTVSLFLPWHLDPFPDAGQSPVVTGIEFITSGSWAVIMAYGFTLLAYAVSKFSTRTWGSVIPLIAACILYFFNLVWITMSLGGPGIYLGRHLSSLQEMMGGVEPLAGVPVNWAGLLALTVGVYEAESRQGRTAVLSAWVGIFPGLALWFYGNMSAWDFFQPHAPPLIFLALQCGLPLSGAVVGLWLGLKRAVNVNVT